MIFFNIAMTFCNRKYLHHLACYNRKDMSTENAVNCATIIILMNRWIATQLFRTENTYMCVLTLPLCTHINILLFMQCIRCFAAALANSQKIRPRPCSKCVTLTSKDFQALFMVKNVAAHFLEYSMHQLKHFQKIMLRQYHLLMTPQKLSYFVQINR